MKKFVITTKLAVSKTTNPRFNLGATYPQVYQQKNANFRHFFKLEHFFMCIKLWINLPEVEPWENKNGRAHDALWQVMREPVSFSIPSSGKNMK